MSFFFMMSKIQVPKIEDNEVLLKCSKCGEESESCYLCREREIILCPYCQNTWPMARCPHNQGEHMHILFPGKQEKNSDYMDQCLKISNGNKLRKD